MVRIVAIALAVLAVAGCGADTVLRIDVEPGALAPTSLVVSLSPLGAAPRTITPVTLPGTIVLHGLPSSVSQLCVEVDALDAAGNAMGGGAATVNVVPHGTATASITLSDPGVACATPPGDLGVPEDMAGGGGGGGGGGVGGGGGAPVDLATVHDMATIQICPAGAIFCDDFETGTLAKWNYTAIKSDAGTVTVQSTTKAHGTYALRALGNGAPGADVYSDAVKNFTPTAPPFALRANVYFPTTLNSFQHVIALYENDQSSTNEFSLGGDNNGTWVVTENEANAPDRHSDMVPTDAGKWHCLELVIDATGMVTFYVDNHKLVGPWQRASNITYSSLWVGVTRSVSTDYVAYIDDVAIGPSRLYCPP